MNTLWNRMGITLGAWLALLAACPAAAPPTSPRPNVLLIIADDQGYGDFGFMGNKLVRTPRLDRLAEESAVFKNFVVAPACSPTRAAIYTGRNHLVTGVWGVPPRANLLPDEARMPAFFKAAGYRTLHVGKLDCVAMGRDHPPTEFGWERWLGCGGYEHHDPKVYGPGFNRQVPGWTVDIYSDETVKFIREHRGEPWFVSLAYIIPHLPWVCDEKDSAEFLAAGCSPKLAACYGSILEMDRGIGRVLDALRETGQEERTIVAFVSDNGMTGPEVEGHLPADGFVHAVDWDKRNVARLRGHKSTVWENGIRQPFLLRWPGVVMPGQRRQFGAAEDILPTLLDLAAVPEATVKHLPLMGVSLRPALDRAGETFERPTVLRMAIAGRGAPRDGITDPRQRKFQDHDLALRGPRFKYHARPDGHGELYDLDADLGEMTDVQSRFPEVAARMAAECRARWEEVTSSGRSFIPLPTPPGRKDPAKVDGKLSEEWFWSLGTWTEADGVLRGYESGPRRHGPIVMQKLSARDATVECEFRLEGKATFAGIIFNGSQERGHIVHLVMGKDRIRILVHPKKGEDRELLAQPAALAGGQWHRVKIAFKGSQVVATVDGETYSATHDCIAEEKLSFGLGGDSGGPEGEKVGVLKFRNLRIQTKP